MEKVIKTLIFLSCIFTVISCSDSDKEIPPQIVTTTLRKYALSDTTLINYRAFIGSDNGAVLSYDTALMVNKNLNSWRIHGSLKETTYTFIQETDSVYVDGILYMYTTSNGSTKNNIYSDNHKYQYDFKSNKFRVLYENKINPRDKRVLTIGYGDKDKFSVFIENGGIYNTEPGGSSHSSIQFIDPQYINESTEEFWIKNFFFYTHSWAQYNIFTPDNFPSEYRGVWYVMRYDFVLSEEIIIEEEISATE